MNSSGASAPLSPSVSAQAPALAEIDGQPIQIATMADVLEKTMARLKAGLGFTLFTLNMDHLVKRRVDPAFRAAYSRANFVTADGAPLVWLAARQGVKVERTTGADMLLPLCGAAAAAGIPISLFGSSPESLNAAANELRRRFPRIDIRHIEAPKQGFDPASSEAQAAGERMARSGARLCFIALGAPKQELFADRMAPLHPSIGYLGVGAALDFVSGIQKRAPLFFQNNGLEWVWRLLSDPWRLASRYTRCALVLADLTIVAPLLRGRIGASPRSSRG